MIRPNKFLGQNFLKSAKIAEEIVEVAEIKPEDIVLEVGPGRGVLTELLIKKAKKVIAIEKDERLVEFLREKFAGEIKNGQLEIACGDILEFNHVNYPLKTGSYKIVANIPYYITSRFLRNFLSSDKYPYLMILMVQKEVAERIRAKDGKESLLSISVKAYGQPKIIRKVPAGYFSPAPKVDSAVIKIVAISKSFFKSITEKSFFELAKKGFSQKRKMLINNLGLGNGIFEVCGVPLKARAENLSLENWKCLVKNNVNKKESF